MRKLVTVAVVALVAATATQLGASAQTRRSCSFTLTGLFTEVRVNSGRPPQSGSNTGVAIVDGTVCGKPFHGAVRDVNHFPKLGKVNGTAVIFSPFGSISLRFAATATIERNHSVTLRGRSTITGGTGIYANAAGTATDLGRQAPNSPITIQHLAGTLDY